MHKLNLAWHLAFIVLLGTVGAVVSNLPYTYIEAFRTESTKQAAVFHEDQWPGDQEATVMAGWPIKYFVKLENANTGPFTTFNWIRLLGNVACLGSTYGAGILLRTAVIEGSRRSG